jgi:acid stress-induced BolA-like protein IbaG/YrbA
VLEKAHHVLSLESPLLLNNVELAFVEGDGAHSRQMIAAEMFAQYGRLSYRGVSPNHHRQQVKARLIAEHNRLAFLQRPFFREG